jgi:peptide/nickel transport system substrate-binding protein
MARNRVAELNELYLRFCEGKIDRRELLTRASTLGLSAAALASFARVVPLVPQPAAAQTPTGGFKSITYQEYKARLNENFPFTKDRGAQKEGGTVIYGEVSTSNITTTNALLGNNSPTNDLNALCFEYLYGTDPKDAQYVPNLADYWEIAEDGKTYTFHLQRNVTWHDGTPFTAKDVIASFDAQKDEATGSSYTASFNDAVASYRAIDDHTVEVVANDVFAQIVFLGNLLTPIIPAHIWENVPHDQWKTDPGSTGQDPSRVIGTGPFKFVEINEGEGTTTWVRNENYWDPDFVPTIERFIFQVWPDETAAVEALRAGEIDFYQDIPPSDVESLQSDPNIEVKIYDTYRFRWYAYNLDPSKTPLFQDVRVRRALFIALDRQSLVDNIQLGYATVAVGTQPVLSIAYDPDRVTVKYNYDPEQAKQLLDEAGWKDTDGDGIREFQGVEGVNFPTPEVGTKLSFDLMFASGVGQLERLAAAMQDYWKAIGVDAQPNPVDFDTVMVPALTETFDFRLIMLGFQWDPTGDQKAMFGSEYKGTGFNAMGYSNPEYDKLAAQADRELDPEKRKELLIKASDIVNTDLPVGIIWFNKEITAYAKRLHNFEPNATGGLLWSMPFVWVE